MYNKLTTHCAYDVKTMCQSTSSVKSARSICFITLAAMLLLCAEPACAADLSGVFGGVTDTLKSVVKLLIYDWGYYIGIAALALQGYRWWAGHITMMDFLKWSVGIVFVFFAPAIVDAIRQNAGQI